MLRERHNQIAKYTKSDLEEIHVHYQTEYANMRQLRMDGDEGYLLVTPYD